MGQVWFGDERPSAGKMKMVRRVWSAGLGGYMGMGLFECMGEDGELKWQGAFVYVLREQPSMTLRDSGFLSKTKK
ncbi:hypothetical protein NC652_039538 [Populus alba x Populus x berolinensis]|nr:hypothetical protein NC652_039538 [Populus alba x Populus x berolinensis]